MRKIINRQYLTTTCFLLFILLFFLLGLQSVVSGSLAAIRGFDWHKGFDSTLVEIYFDDRFPFKYSLITLNGGVQRLLGRRAVNERVRLDNGYLSDIIPPTDLSDKAAATVEFFEGLEAREIPSFYVCTLTKIDSNEKHLPVGIEDYSNENVDQFIKSLRESKVSVLDLREMEPPGDHYSRFFYTDHHWTPETGLWAYTVIEEQLCSIDNSFAVDPMIGQISNYTMRHFEDILLGSAGRRVGPLYCWYDDFDVLYPRFPTALRLLIDGNMREGSFDNTIIFEEVLEGKDRFHVSTYSAYLSDYYKIQTENLSDGENGTVQNNGKTLLIIGDSFSNVVAPYFMMGYKYVHLLDLRTFDEGLWSYIDYYKPDAVFVLHCPWSICTNEYLFQYR